MSLDHGAPVRFHLEETIWLDQRTPIVDMINLDLQPEVEVSEADQLVNISGYLLLRGQFQTTDEALDIKNSSLEDQLSFQSLQVEQTELDFSRYEKIEKRIPLDVTVPRDKVENLDDVYVSVDQFDYTLEGGNCLVISADISLLGVENGLKVDNTLRKQNRLAEEDEGSEPPAGQEMELSMDVGESRENQVASEGEGESPSARGTLRFQVSARAEEGEEKAQEEPASQDRGAPQSADGDQRASAAEEEIEASQAEREARGKTEERETRREEAQAIESEADEERGDQEAEPDGPAERGAVEEREQAANQEESYEEPAEEQAGAKDEGQEASTEEQGQQRVAIGFLREADEPQESEAETGSEADSIETEAEAKESASVSEKRGAEKMIGFLSQLLSKKEEAPSKTRLKMCIIQRHETLEQVAERYEVSPEAIMRFNRMSSSQVSEGDVLYIPVKE